MAGRGITLGFLKFVLGFDSVAFEQGSSDAEKRLRSMQRSFEQTATKIGDFGKNLTAGITLPLAALATKGIAEAQETAAAMAQVNAALTSMGPVAGRSAEQLVALADALELDSLYEGDQILREVTANLLTFGTLSGEVFDRAQQATVDLATRLGTDLSAAAIQVGRALNDPVKGVTALARAGIQFTAAQRAQIAALVETGNAAGAQSIILAELERQFGGSAKAAANVDPLNRATDAFNQMAEKIGTALLPVLPVLADAVVAIVDGFTALSPETQKWVLILGGVLAAIGPVAVGIGAIVSVIGTALPALAAIGTAWTAMAAAAAAATPFIGALAAIGTAWTAMAAAAAAATPFIGALTLAALPWIAAAAGIVAAAVAVYNHWDDIKAVFAQVADAAEDGFARVVAAFAIIKANLIDVARFVLAIVTGDIQGAFGAVSSIAERTFGLLPGQITGYMQQLVDGVRTWISDRLNAVWDGVVARVEVVRRAFFGLYDAVVGNSYIPDMVTEIGQHMARLDATLVAPATRATGAAAQAFRALQQQVSSIFDRLFPAQARFNAYQRDLSALAAYHRQAGSSAEVHAAAVHRLRREYEGIPVDGLGGLAAELPEVDIGTVISDDQIRAMVDRWSGAADSLEAQNVRIVESFAQLAQGAIGELDNLVKGIRSGNILDIFSSIIGALDKIGGLFGGFNIGGVKFGGARADGGPVSSGRTYLVGERGPELFKPGSAGSIISNDNMRGRPSRVEIVPSPYFTAIVDGRVQSGIAGAAPAIAGAGSAGAVQTMQRRQSRRVA